MGAPALEAFKGLHDLLLTQQGNPADHTCMFCDDSKEGLLMGDAVSKEDLAQAVADAVAPLQAALTERDAKIAELSDKLGERDATEAVTQAVADAVAPLNEKIEELQTALDTEVVARGKAENELKEISDALEVQAQADAEQARRDDRIKAVKDAGIFPEDAFDESVQVNKDRIDKWAAMEDGVFADLVDGWALAGPAKSDADNGKLPTGRSSMTDALTGKGGANKASGRSGIRIVAERSIPSLAAAGSDS